MNYIAVLKLHPTSWLLLSKIRYIYPKVSFRIKKIHHFVITTYCGNIRIMKKLYSFINPFFDTWFIYSLIVFYILLYFVFLVVKTIFYNMDIIIPIVYIPMFILTLVLPYFIVENKACRIIAINQGWEML